MKVRVLKPFRDKHTNKPHRSGETFECDERRMKEILAVGPLIEKVPGPEEEAATKDVAKDRFDKMTAKELRVYADTKHKLTFGCDVKRAEMIAVLRNREKNN